MIVIAGKVAVKPEARDIALAEMKTVVEATQSDAGRVMYDFYEDLLQPNTFFIYELWETEEKLEAHLQQAHTKHFLAVLMPLVVSPPNISRYEVEGSAPLF